MSPLEGDAFLHSQMKARPGFASAFSKQAAHRQGQRLPFHLGGRQLLLCRFHPLPGGFGQLV